MSLFQELEAPPPTLQDLLQIEDTEEILEFTCPKTGIPIWSQGRIAFFRLILGDLLYQSPLPGRLDGTATRASAALTLFRFALHNARARLASRNRTPILIKGDAVTDQWTDGGWRNPLADSFADATPGRATILYDHYAWRWPFPRHGGDPLFMAPLQARHALAGALKADRRERDLARSLVELVAGRAVRNFGWDIGDARKAWLIRYLAHKAAVLPGKYTDYRRLLDRLGSRLLLVTEGCYGHHAALIAAARDRDVLTAEYQHGCVTTGHDAYNFAPVIRASAAYRRALPDVFLSHGEWWGTQMNVPVELVAIGNPARPERAREDGVRDTILILSDGIDFPLYLQLAHHVSARVAGTGLAVVLRPHPIERASVLDRYGAVAGEVRIDAAGGIYDAFATARVVISEVSTGLFEAVGLVDHVWLLATPKSGFSVPSHPFQRIDDMSNLDRCLGCLSSNPPPGLDVEKLWRTDWQGNYLRFLEDRGILES